VGGWKRKKFIIGEKARVKWKAWDVAFKKKAGEAQGILFLG